MKLSKILHWKSYCSEPLELIENYQQALAENFKGWCIHHRLEIQQDGTRVSAKELIDQGLYYCRPAEELIFMRFEEHSTLHHKGENHPFFGKHRSEETRKKIAEALKDRQFSTESRKKMSESKKGENHPFFGKHRSEESRKKIAEALKDRTFSAEHRKKLSEALKGRTFSAESRKKMSESKKGENHPFFGKHHSEETRRKIAEAKKGKHWYNNGGTSILAKTCPEGFVPGRLK